MEAIAQRAVDHALKLAARKSEAIKLDTGLREDGREDRVRGLRTGNLKRVSLFDFPSHEREDCGGIRELL